MEYSILLHKVMFLLVSTLRSIRYGLMLLEQPTYLKQFESLELTLLYIFARHQKYMVRLKRKIFRLLKTVL